MPVTVELIKSDLVEQLEHIAKQRLEPDRVEVAQRFIRGLYHHAPPGDLVRERPEHLYASAVSMLGFARQRLRGEPAVRIYTPRLDEHGWQSSHSVVEIITDDMPFLVDSITAELQRQGAELLLLVHSIFEVQRDADGVLLGLEEASEPPARPAEAFQQVHIRALPQQRFEAIREGLLHVLGDVRLAVSDFSAMRARCSELIGEFSEHGSNGDPEDKAEAIAFLDWLNQDHFTFLGYRHCMFHPEEGSLVLKARCIEGLGILRSPEREVFEGFQPPDSQDLLRIFKANQRSTVHRPVHFDAIVMPDRNGSDSAQERGVHLFIGLFTLSAYSRSPASIPLLRHKIARTIERSGLSPHSHDGKVLHYVLETYPRDELFQISVDNLLAISMGVLHLQGRPRVALFVRRDPFNRFVSCLVYLPRDRMDTSLRLNLQAVLEKAFNGTVSAYYTHLGDEALARLLIIVKTPHGAPPHVDHMALERKLRDVSRSWSDRLHAALINELGEERGLARARQFERAFPLSYRERFDATTAAADIEYIERALDVGHFQLHLYRPVEAPLHAVWVKIYNPTGFLQLSDVLPMLENMGLRVISEVPYPIRLADNPAELWIHDFSATAEDGRSIDISLVRDDFVSVFGAALDGSLENDGFNRLVLSAGLGVREVRLLRAYAKFLRQVRVPFSLDYMQATLRRNARITRMLVELFSVRFAPASDRQPGKAAVIAADVAENEILARLDSVVSLDEDRILRRFLNAIQATVRTNAYQRDESGALKGYISLKFDSAALDDLPEPRPYREVFVFSPRVEGVHLRFGAVARGGLRWSDRLEDFRTEVLGLVKAQRVKNAVIVPVGSKGGFVVKRRPPPAAGRQALQAESIACYETFVRGLLDVTDNREGEEIRPPKDVVRLDGADPYLVVAADKGTATFSDIANAISKQYGFWLDDAFASGGSAGYDHKKMAITARGAWESIKRHFRELGRNIQQSDFSVVGVGDMSGDVFGNGMLLSPHIRLVAAFNHQHVFIDPNPDAQVSFAERKRLFELPSSTWMDYAQNLLSKGGAIYSRDAKLVELSPEARASLGVDAEQLTPSELISHVLRAPVDLLFFGGIGTYVKASSESHADSGDRANDLLRVDAKQLCAKVIGEGANLGMTQLARIEFALAGGRCNTDFIDNSGGVDCSDHEVNIKILLGEVERAGDLTRKQRDQLLQEMTDEVADLVLRDNYLQTQAISVTQRIGVRYTDRLARSMKALERAGRLDRALEALPDPETLIERVHARVGFARPELCVLLSYLKNSLYEELLASELPDDPFLEADLMHYFPRALQQRFPEWIKRHRLRREIIATVVCNDLVNRAGLTFVQEVSERTGMPAAKVAAAYVAAREIHRMSELWSDVEALDNRATADAQASILMDAGRLLVVTTTWLLRHRGAALNVKHQIVEYEAGVSELCKQVEVLIGAEERQAFDQRVAELSAAKVPQATALLAAKLPILACSCDVVFVSRRLGREVAQVAGVYFQVGQRFGFDWLRSMAVKLPTERAWDKQAVAALIDELYTTQRQLVAAMLTGHHGELDAPRLVDAWATAEALVVERTQQLITELRATPVADLAMLAVANRQLKAMLSGHAND